ncbi:MAG: hypothetical protein JEZ14_17160 [Marinilabiliaceae bacterium]|nr:hypothetical protein [Marinilabiliaceae bacterium]
MEYKIEVKERGNYYIEVLRKEAHNVYCLEWSIDLKNDSYVECSHLYENRKIIAIDRDGRLRIFDIVTRSLLFEKDFNSRYSIDMQILKNQEGIAVAYQSKKDKKDWLEVVSINDYSTMARYELSREARSGDLQLGINEEILFYYNDNDDLGSVNWEHGYYRLDAESSHLSRCPLPAPQREEFDRRPPFLNPELRIGVMPCWEKVEIRQNEAGENSFVYKLSVFSLDDFKIIHTFPVREFKANELSCLDYSCDEMEEGLLKNDFYSEKYQEAQSDFIENLNSLVFDNENYCFWICFRGGIMMKVGYNGSVSPQFEPERHPNLIRKGRDEYFHSYIHSRNKSEFILNEHWSFYRFTITEEALNSTDKIVYLPLEELEKRKVIMTDEEKMKQQERGTVVIEVDDLDLPQGYLEALDKMIELTDNIDAIRSGFYLKFRVKDKKGRVEQDDVFFKNAVMHAGAAEKINEVLNDFFNCDEAELLRFDNETPAMAHAVLALARTDEEYVEMATVYFYIIDLEHDVFCQDVVASFLIEQYPDNPHVKKLDEYLGQYYCG